jgi:hypothetical protein
MILTSVVELPVKTHFRQMILSKTVTRNAGLTFEFTGRADFRANPVE